MPSLEISLKDLENLVGKKLPQDKLESILEYAKAEIENIEGDNLKLSIEDSNRPDLWCIEGIARQIKGNLGIETGLKKYKANKTNLKVIVDKKMKNVRPYIACSIIKGVKITDEFIRQTMQQQEKLHITFGRDRKKVSIGLYNFDMLTFPLKFKTTKPNQNAFIPLEMDKKMTPKEILTDYPRGKDYAYLLEGMKEYPIFMDSKNKVLSFPPIINSNDLGRLIPETKNVLIEVTGFDFKAVNLALIIMSLSLADRGGKIYQMKVDYPYMKKQMTPVFENSKMKLDFNEVNKRLGTNFDKKTIEKLLKKAGYGIKGNTVEIPFYRADIMHPVDIMEDIAIAYGYNNLKPSKLNIPAIGGISDKEVFSDKIRELCVGMGMQEVMTFTLTNKDTIFKKMNIKEEKAITVENPISSNLDTLRNWLLPSLMEFLSKNTTAEYPQKIFETGDCFSNMKEKRKLAFAITHDKVNLTEIKSNVEIFLKTLGVKYQIKSGVHPSFIETRYGEIFVNNEKIGFFGELHPQVLSSWGMKIPVIAFEIDLEKLSHPSK